MGGPVKSARILIVDDEYSARKVLRALLSSLGAVDIHDAVDGASGLEAMRTLAPDVVLLDWDMPGMNGAEFTRHLRSPGHFPYPNVPIIMLTSHGNRSCVMEAVRLGIHGFLLKPVSSGALLERIESVLSKPRPLAAYKAGIGRYNPLAEQAVE